MAPFRILLPKTLRTLLQNPNPSSFYSSLESPKPKTLYSIFAKPSPSRKIPSSPSPGASTVEEKNLKKRRATPSPCIRPSSDGMEEKGFPKELSPEMASLVRRFHEEGYLKNANFVVDEGEFDPQKIPRNYYSRHFLKVASEKFGLAYPEIAKWLSGSDLKKVAFFGCPSIDRGTVLAAKRMRSFFSISEEDTCRVCMLKSSCKFVNHKVGREEKVHLADVMRLLTIYSLDSIPQKLSVPEDLKLSVGKLMKDIVNLSK